MLTPAAGIRLTASRVVGIFGGAIADGDKRIENPAYWDKVVALAPLGPLRPVPIRAEVNGQNGARNPSLTRKRWDSMRAFTAFVPAWDKYVYEPCARISGE